MNKIDSVGEEISPTRWRIAPALNPKKRRGLSVLLVARLVDEHTRAHEGLEWFRLSERNTLGSLRHSQVHTSSQAIHHTVE